MPSTQPYGPTFNFADDPAPQDLVNAQALQGQLQLIAANLADLILALGISIRDDNTLTDELVRLRNLHPELRLYLDSRLAGTVLTQNLTYLLPVKGATVANLASLASPGTGPTIDGVTYVAGDRILVKDQTNKTQNGIWIVQTSGAGAWTRATDMPAGAAIDSNTGVVVRSGTSQGETAWQRRPAPTSTNPDVYPAAPVVSTNPQDFFQIYGPFPVPVGKGGTGATTAAGARTNLGAAGKFVGTITGDGTTTTFTLTHNLGTVAVSVECTDPVTGEQFEIDTNAISTTQVVATLVLPPAVGEQILVTIIG